MESGKPNPPLFWGTLITVVALDLVTKLIAAATLSPQHIPHEILGNHLRLTLVYNPGRGVRAEPRASTRAGYSWR